MTVRSPDPGRPVDGRLVVVLVGALVVAVAALLYAWSPPPFDPEASVPEWPDADAFRALAAGELDDGEEVLAGLLDGLSVNVPRVVPRAGPAEATIRLTGPAFPDLPAWVRLDTVVDTALGEGPWVERRRVYTGGSHLGAELPDGSRLGGTSTTTMTVDLMPTLRDALGDEDAFVGVRVRLHVRPFPLSDDPTDGTVAAAADVWRVRFEGPPR